MVQKMIRAEALSFEYKDSSEGIHDVSFEINKGEVILLTGNSGCGKSTWSDSYNHRRKLTGSFIYK